MARVLISEKKKRIKQQTSKYLSKYICIYILNSTNADNRPIGTWCIEQKKKNQLFFTFCHRIYHNIFFFQNILKTILSMQMQILCLSLWYTLLVYVYIICNMYNMQISYPLSQTINTTHLNHKLKSSIPIFLTKIEQKWKKKTNNLRIIKNSKFTNKIEIIQLSAGISTNVNK